MKPEIRFNGFNDEWVEKKLGDVSKIQTGSSNAQDASDDGEYPFYIRSDTVKKSNKYIFEGEAVLIPGEGRIGEIFHYANGKFDIHQRVYAISSFQGMSGLYLLNVLRKNFGHHAAKYSVKATVDSLRLPVIQQFPIQLPTLPEQQKIGGLFSKYDAIIGLREQKLEELSALKKGLLQKMFPKNGVKVPELRFAGFADDWEEHRVGSFLSESRIKGSNGLVSKKLTVKLWRKGIIPKEEIYKGSSATQYYVRLAGQFMYGKLDFLNQAFGILPNELDGYESTLDSPAFDFKDGINPDFFLEYVCQESFYKYQGDIANGSRKAKRIHADTFFDMPISIPILSEQQKIGQLFKHLDDRISNEQTKIEQLKEQKQGLLERMLTI